MKNRKFENITIVWNWVTRVHFIKCLCFNCLMCLAQSPPHAVNRTASRSKGHCISESVNRDIYYIKLYIYILFWHRFCILAFKLNRRNLKNISYFIDFPTLGKGNYNKSPKYADALLVCTVAQSSAVNCFSVITE